MSDRYFAATGDEGPYIIGPCATPEDAYADAKDEFDPEDSIVIGRGRIVQIHLDGDSIIDNLGNDFYDELYEDAMDTWCHDVSSAAKTELGNRLTKVLHEWLVENKQPFEFECIDIVSFPKKLESERT